MSRLKQPIDMPSQINNHTRFISTRAKLSVTTIDTSEGWDTYISKNIKIYVYLTKEPFLTTALWFTEKQQYILPDIRKFIW